MPNNNLLALVACLPGLPKAAYTVFAGADDRNLRLTVAASPNLDDTIRHTLTRDPDPMVRRAALSGVTDSDYIVERVVAGGHCETLGAARNPNTPASLLTDFAATEHPLIAREALANPSTPTDAVLHRAAAAPAEALIPKAQDSFRATAAALIVTAHPEVADLWAGDKDAAVRRIVARTPRISEHAAALLTRTGKAGERSLALNPWAPSNTLYGRFAEVREMQNNLLAACDIDRIDQWQDKDILFAALLGSPTLDLLIAQTVPGHPVFFDTVMRRTEPQPDPEPDTLGLLLRASDPFRLCQALTKYAGTRLGGAALVAPEYAQMLTDTWKARAATKAYQATTIDMVASLGESADAWEVFARMAPNWTGTVDGLAAAAMGIAA